jgi:hypothetical protein
MLTDKQEREVSTACYQVGSRASAPYIAKILELENRVAALEKMIFTLQEQRQSLPGIVPEENSGRVS